LKSTRTLLIVSVLLMSISVAQNASAQSVARTDVYHVEFIRAALGSPIMLADEVPGMGFRSPESLGGSPISMLLYAAGAKVQRPVADQFYGDRTGGVTDPFGHVWYIATHKEDVSPEEMKKRAAAAAGQ
jgi:uncharacterized glyoxalase superfamily protein PhnB